MDRDSRLNMKAFIPGMVVLGAFILSGIFAMEKVGLILNKILYGVAENFGWYLNLLALLTLIISLGVVCTKFGKIKIGGGDAKTEFSRFHWCAMAICGGIGTGLLFWAMGEPLYHFAGPPTAAGVDPFTREAGIFAVSQAMLNWSFVQYGSYSLIAVAFALLVYNRKKSLSFGSILESVFGKEIPWLETIIHALLIFCLCGAVANSMGVGLMQIGAGLEAVFSIKASPVIWLMIAATIALIFIASCVSGLGKGLKLVSTITIYIFFGILVYVVVMGDTKFIAKMFVESVGEILQKWPSKTVMLNTMAPGDTWSADWIIQYYSSFFVYAPVIGMFLCRMAKGRTVREFMVVNIFVPSIFCWIWIAIFGGMTIGLQYNGSDIWGAIQQSGMESTVYQILGSLPLGMILCAVFLISIIGSFCTCADPMSAALATMSVRRLSVDDEAPRGIKILIGVCISTISYILVASGGITSVKGMFTLVGLPISLLVILCIVSAFKEMKREYKVSFPKDDIQ